MADLLEFTQGIGKRESSRALSRLGHVSDPAAPSDQQGRTMMARLAKAAVHSASVEAFLAVTGTALWSSPLQVERVFLSLQTLHPAFRARTYVWKREDGRVHTVEWPHGLRNRPGYYESPDFYVHNSRTEFRLDQLQQITHPRCDLYSKLKTEGYTDYLMVPLLFSDGSVNTLSIATKLAGGFPQDEVRWYRELGDMLVVILERYTALESVSLALDTYLGRNAARQILSGHIRSGYGNTTEAAILFADLNGFTDHAARLGPASTVRLLNDYFDCLVGPIEAHGGYVLKFIGDAVLAFFPLVQDNEKPEPLVAVQSIRIRLRHLNQTRQEAGAFPIRHALCVHFGHVLYGNVGSSERLDFTIIGEAVNVAARGVEAAKSMDWDYIFTAAFAEQFGTTGLLSLGPHAFRGSQTPLEVFTLADSIGLSGGPDVTQLSYRAG